MERSADAGLDEAAAGVRAGQERKRAMGRGSRSYARTRAAPLRYALTVTAPLSAISTASGASNKGCGLRKFAWLC
jgi:hypothetical protein